MTLKMSQNDLLNHLTIRPLRQNVPKNVRKDVLLNSLKIKLLSPPTLSEASPHHTYTTMELTIQNNQLLVEVERRCECQSKCQR